MFEGALNPFEMIKMRTVTACAVYLLLGRVVPRFSPELQECREPRGDWGVREPRSLGLNSALFEIPIERNLEMLTYQDRKPQINNREVLRRNQGNVTFDFQHKGTQYKKQTMAYI